MKLFLLLFIFIFSGLPGFQKIKNQNTENEKDYIVYEKVYLHIDRELYSPGEDVWFKSYLVSGINHQLIPGYKNIYIQLVAQDGSIVDQVLLLSENGTAHGDFRLSNSIPDGNYTVRAYTRYLRNFGEESFFHKKIVVSNVKNLLEIAESIPEQKSSEIDVDFLPESGSFVLNAVNYIAFKAIDETGKGVPVKGKVFDESGNEVVSFRDSYNGMGKFVMMPQEGKTYFARIDGYPGFEYEFEPARPDRIAVHYKPDGNYLVFTMTRNLKIYNTQEFLLVVSHKGTELFKSQITMKEFQHAIRFYKGLFPLGISKVTLYHSGGEIMAERLVFVRNENESNLQIRVNKAQYGSREKVEIDLTSLLAENDTILSSLSVAVVNEDYFSVSGNSQTIESFLLLDSELKGSIDSPASCFVDEPGISASEKLDLVMLVNGWRSYYWNDLEKYAGMELPGWADIGLTLEGTVTRLLGRRPVENGKVILGPFSGEFLMEETTTDKDGNFSFENLYLKDDALVMINAELESGRRRTDISLEQPLVFDSLVPPGLLDSVCFDIQAPVKFYRDIYYRREAEQEFQVEQGTVLLGEINVEGKLEPLTDGHFRLYGEPDHSFTITNDDWTFANILDYLEARVPGVVITGEEISIRAGFGNPLLLVDGLEVDWDYVKYLPIGDIDKIEILKNSANMAIYGAQGGNGVISILTKIGYGEFNHYYVRNVPGRITPRIKGFQQPRQFYSPQYTWFNQDDPIPDLRSTLYWNPNIYFNEGEAKVEFFTGDKPARYQIIVEGISKNGKIIYGTNLLTVIF